MFHDAREPLVEIAVQLLIVVLDHEPSTISVDRNGEHDAVRILSYFLKYCIRIAMSLLIITLKLFNVIV